MLDGTPGGTSTHATSGPAGLYRPVNAVRVVTAASLFDGHDAAINVMRRLIQAAGCEVVHLGHNRAAGEVVEAALQEDAQAVAVSSYQGGHAEYFQYLRRLLVHRGAPHVRIFGGGGGVITPPEIRALQEAGVTRIYHPEDGRRLGLEGIISDLVRRSDYDLLALGLPSVDEVRTGEHRAVARAITAVEAEVASPGRVDAAWLEAVRSHRSGAPVVGLTGTGGAGKSSLTDELLLRLRHDHPGLEVAILSVDPSRRRTGGALLGDRIRMNAVYSGAGEHRGPTFVRSLATRSAGGELSAAIRDAIAVVRLAGFDLILVETSGIGQGDARIMDVADVGLYVMTPEYGAASQLEKIEMLDVAHLVAVNKLERQGGLDAVAAVRKQVQRNRARFDLDPDQMPVYGTIASRFNDPGVTATWHGLRRALREVAGLELASSLPEVRGGTSLDDAPLVPVGRSRYLGRIAEVVRAYHARVAVNASRARQRQHLLAAAELLGSAAPELLSQKAAELVLDADAQAAVGGWGALRERYAGDDLVYEVRGREVRQPLVRRSLAGSRIPRVVLPRTEDDGERVRWTLLENVPGGFPFTAGVFPLKREAESPKRMFAGEGGPARTNARFHYLCKGEAAHRLSTAFDSVTLYGEDPSERPDVFGKVGESGVSVPHLDDMKVLYGGFDLCAPTTSVSMTINGPAPILLAMFLNTAIDQQLDAAAAGGGGLTEDQAEAIRARTVQVVRGTVQADILKEDQAQNTCIFSTEFALRMQGDIQRWFEERGVRNYYSVSISGYHIAEAGANPITQLAFTLSNGFTFVEYFLSRGMRVDAFAPNLSFFFSNGLDPEYAVLGRVARRIWAVAMRDRYGADERSQKLKYHIQTSGRSLHAQEIQFNDIRTTLQALLAFYDNCNSLHTNAYDEAITTPTEASVRRAMAIQLILNAEFGMLMNENPTQGSFLVEQLTELVEEAVLAEFERLDARGGVLGAMETQYQRSRIQEESLLYERLKHSGELPVIGVNTFLDPETLVEGWEPAPIELRRATTEEKQAQIESVRAFQARHADTSGPALKRLQAVARSGGNLFDELMRTVRVATLGQITAALYEVGGRYRRNL